MLKAVITKIIRKVELLCSALGTGGGGMFASPEAWLNWT